MSKARKKCINYTNKRVDDTILEWLDQDENFYFIAGYTEGGAPYGTTWEEHEELGRREQLLEQRKATKRDIKITAQQLHSIIECFYRHHDERMVPYLNLSSGDVVTVNEWDGDEYNDFLSDSISTDDPDYEYIPMLEYEDKVGELREFAQTVSDAYLKRKLYDQLGGGRNRLRKFMRILSFHREENTRHTAYKMEQDRNRVKEWLSSLGVELHVDEE